MCGGGSGGHGAGAPLRQRRLRRAPSLCPGPAHALLSPQQGHIEVDSETVFKLAALVLQVSVSPRLGLAHGIPFPGSFSPAPYGAPAGMFVVSAAGELRGSWNS